MMLFLLISGCSIEIQLPFWDFIYLYEFFIFCEEEIKKKMFRSFVVSRFTGTSVDRPFVANIDSGKRVYLKLYEKVEKYVNTDRTTVWFMKCRDRVFGWRYRRFLMGFSEILIMCTQVSDASQGADFEVYLKLK